MTILYRGQMLTTVGPAAVQALMEAVVHAIYQAYPERFPT